MLRIGHSIEFTEFQYGTAMDVAIATGAFVKFFPPKYSTYFTSDI